jgi:cell division protein FtsQ
MSAMALNPTPPDLRLMQFGTRALLLLFALALVAAGLMAVARSSWFALRQIRIEGEVTHNNATTIRAAALPRLSGNYLTMNLQAAKAAFESVPWVRRATVSRVWPHTLVVALEEHRPVAFWERDEGDDALVDGHGEVFEVNLGDVDDDDLPTLRGPRDSAATVWGLYAALAPLFARRDERIERLALSDRGSWQLKLDTGTVVEMGRGTTDEVAGRVRRYADTVGQISARFGNRRIEYADLRHVEGYALRVAGMGTTDPKTVKKR